MTEGIEPPEVVLRIRGVGQFRSLSCSGDDWSSLVIGQCSRGLGLGSMEGAGVGGLVGAGFVEAVATRRRGSLQAPGWAVEGVRFAFYGRMATSEFQDPQTLRAWQRAVSDELVEGVGEVVVEFSMRAGRVAGRGGSVCVTGNYGGSGS